MPLDRDSMRWTSVEQLLQAFPISPSYRLEQLALEDVPDLIQRLREWYPDIVVGMESIHLEPSFYERHVQLRGTESDCEVLALVARSTETNELVAMLTLAKDTRAQSLTSRLGAIAPNHRRGGLGFLGPMLLESFGNHLGAGLVYYFATLKSKHQQAIAERRGFRLVGIVPAYDLDTIAPGITRRVYEAVYAKVLAPPDQVHTPAPESLTPQTQKLWDAIYRGGLSA